MLKKQNAYAIMPVGKNDTSVHAGTQKAPKLQLRGFFIPFWRGGLFPQVGYRKCPPSSHLQM